MYNGPDRKLNRWLGYDYKYPGLYFITICTKDRKTWFGNVLNYVMELNEIGEMVKKQLLWIQQHFPYIRLDKWEVMPNHLHAIFEINYDFNNDKTGYTDETVSSCNDGKIFGTPHIVGNVLERSLHNSNKPKILPLYRTIGAFKTTSAKLIRQQGMNDFKWQKSFHDRVIRSETELSNIRDYIIGNPAKWSQDRNNPLNFKK